jgi:putative MATE family efflux protein
MAHTLNLTSGNIQKQLITIAAPLLMCDVLQQLYNTIDAVIIGRYVSTTAFAALGVAGTLMNLFIFIIIGTCSGVTVIFATSYGRGDLAAFRREAFTACLSGSLFTLLVSGLGFYFLSQLLTLLQTPAEVLPLAQEYLQVIVAGLILTFFYNLCVAALRSVGNTRIAVLVLFASILLNIALAFFFVAGLELGITGAALATLLAQLFAVAAFIYYLEKYLPQLLFTRSDWQLDKHLLGQTANYGLSTALQHSSLYIGKLLVQAAVNSMGTGMITAFTATTRLEGFANSFGDSGAQAGSIFVAQNHGAGKDSRALQGFRADLKLLLPLSVLLSLLMFGGAQAGVTAMIGTPSPEELSNGVAYMRWIALFYAFNFIGSAFVGLFRGHGYMAVNVFGTASQITIRVVLSWLFINTYGLTAVAVASGIGWIYIVLYQYGLYKHYRLGQGGENTAGKLNPPAGTSSALV